MNASDLITLDSLLLSLLVALVGIIAYAGQRYIHKDDEWKKHVDKKLDELASMRVVCLRELASRESMNEAFRVLRDHGGRISALESWRETVDTSQ